MVPLTWSARIGILSQHEVKCSVSTLPSPTDTKGFWNGGSAFCCCSCLLYLFPTSKTNLFCETHRALTLFYGVEYAPIAKLKTQAIQIYKWKLHDFLLQYMMAIFLIITGFFFLTLNTQRLAAYLWSQHLGGGRWTMKRVNLDYKTKPWSQ